jgi:hypothetical protein
MLQVVANTVSVELQDFILLAMPLIAAASAVVTLRIGPALPLVWRIVLGSLLAFVFGHLYFQFFRWIIVETLHVWKRDEGLLMYLASYVALLIWAGAALGAIGGGWLGAKGGHTISPPSA